MTTPLPDPGHPPYGAPSFAKPPVHQVAPPGWYPGPAGGMQWWDGRGWGPPAPPPPDNSNTMAMFCYLGMLFVGFLVPLIILLTEGKKSRFVQHHAAEALNWAITMAIVTLPLVVVYVVAFFAAFGGFATGSGGGAAAGVGVAVVLFILVIVVLIGLSIASLVLTIIGAVRANQRRWFRYPFAIRLVRGAVSKAEAEALDRGGV